MPMSSSTHHLMLVVFFGALFFISSGCKPPSSSSSTPTTPPTPPPSTPNYPLAFNYTIPGTNNVIKVYDDMSGNEAMLTMDTQHALSVLPASQLVGITSLNFSNFVDTIEANVYANLSQQNLNDWTNLVQSRNAPAAEFKTLYQTWLTNSFRGLFNQFFTDIKTHDTFDATEFLTMAAEFLDPVKHIIWAYAPPLAGSGDTYSWTAANLAYSVTNNILNLDGEPYGLGVVNNVLSIVSVEGNAVAPIPVPNIFIQDAGIAAVSDVNGNIAVGEMGTSATGMLSVEGSPAPTIPVLSTAASGKIGKLNIFVSPYTPTYYQSALDRTSQTEMLKEIQILQTNPKEILQQAPGAITHGFTADNPK